jgi:hypothetical protein
LVELTAVQRVVSMAVTTVDVKVEQTAGQMVGEKAV